MVSRNPFCHGDFDTITALFSARISSRTNSRGKPDPGQAQDQLIRLQLSLPRSPPEAADLRVLDALTKPGQELLRSPHPTISLTVSTKANPRFAKYSSIASEG